MNSARSICAIQQSLAADGAIAWPCSLSLNADRAPQLKAHVILFPLMKLMKKTASALALIVVCSVMLHGQAKNSVAKQPAEWSLSLKTGGAPWEKKFEVELNQAGSLVVTEQDPQKMPDDTTWKLAITVPAKDAQEIYEQTLKAFREFRFAEEKVERADGTNLTLRLSANGRVLIMQFFHLGQTEEESVEVARVLSLVNKHLAKEHQVY